MNQQKNVTFVEDLLDIENDTPQEIRRFIRPTQKSFYQGGDERQQQTQHQQQQSQNPYQAQQTHQTQHQQQQSQNPYQTHQTHQTQHQQQQSQNPYQVNEELPIIRENFNPILNCLDIANHTKSCPICTKFYDNDKTVYIIIIIILAVITALLLKRVLEM